MQQIGSSAAEDRLVTVHDIDRIIDV